MRVGCVQRWAAAALAGALALCGLAAGDISFPDIVGEYDLLRGNLGSCTKTAAVSQGVANLPGDALSFGGKACDGVFEYQLAESEGLQQWTAVQRAASGIVLALPERSQVIMSCPSWPSGLVRMLLFIRPRKGFPLRLNGYSKPFELAPRFRYWIIWTDDGGCVYRNATSEPSASSSAPPQRRELTSGQDGGVASDGGDELIIWVWLGPVLGAAATMASALVTVFRCTRRDASDKAAPPPGSEGALAHAEAGGADGAPGLAPPPAWASGYPSPQ